MTYIYSLYSNDFLLKLNLVHFSYPSWQLKSKSPPLSEYGMLLWTIILSLRVRHLISVRCGLENDSYILQQCNKRIKGTSVFEPDFSGLPCLLQLYTKLYLSDYRKFWKTERWRSFD